MKIEFYKYHGTGNDFIILDNRTAKYTELTERQVKFLCHRKFGIGADGLMLLGNKKGYDFDMVYYNADGAIGSMCGNGGRCLVKFAHDLGIHKSSFHFSAIDGEHDGDIEADGKVKLKMTNVNEVEYRYNSFVLNTGSPHFVKYVPEIFDYDVVGCGKEIRYNKEFIEEGINVNFIETIDEDEIFVRTYERGVEDETMSCGTGVTAAAIIAAHNDVGFNRVEVRTPGGKLSVEFDKIDDQSFQNIFLIGPAIMVYKGEMDITDEMMKPLEKLKPKKEEEI